MIIGSSTRLRFADGASSAGSSADRLRKNDVIVLNQPAAFSAVEGGDGGAGAAAAGFSCSGDVLDEWVAS